ncbi:MAG: ferritin family protein [Proteobacteria bacterium]|nr:ferritin family protein [Pseudomonadota bacterium]
MENEEVVKAVKTAIESEKKAVEYYAESADKIGNIGKKLFDQLERFELSHVKKLTRLLDSLTRDGVYGDDENPEPSEIETGNSVTLQENDKLSLMEIIAIAKDNEENAQKAYLELSEKTSDPKGKEMFKKLADEEEIHFETLQKAYWSLNQTGEWTWGG